MLYKKTEITTLLVFTNNVWTLEYLFAVHIHFFSSLLGTIHILRHHLGGGGRWFDDGWWRLSGGEGGGGKSIDNVIIFDFF